MFVWMSGFTGFFLCVCGEKISVSVEAYFPSESTPALSGEINANKGSGKYRRSETNYKQGL